MMPATVSIPDRLLITGPNGGGFAMLSRSRFELLFAESSTGLSISGTQAAWVVQDAPANSIRTMQDGQLTTAQLSDNPLDLHDILLDGTRFWSVASQLNAISCLEHDKEVGRWAYSPEPDSWHVNCLVRHDGRMLASAFGRFDITRGYKGNSRGSGEVFDVKTGETIISGLSQPHSLVSNEGALWLCNSEIGEVHSYLNGKREHCLQIPGYTRGLAIEGDHIYVGISRSRNEPADKIERRFDTAAIAIVDRSSGKVLGYFPVPWNEIYDIRILKSARLAEDLMLAALARRGRPHDELKESTILNSFFSVVHQQHDDVIRAISEDIRHMQATVATALERAANSEGRAAIAEQLADRIDRLGAGQAALHAVAQATQDSVGGMVEHLAQAAAAIGARVDETHALMERELSRVAGITDMRERLESIVAERTKLQIDVQSLGNRIEKLQAELADSRNAKQVLEDELEISRQGRENAERALEGQRHELAVSRHENERLLGIANQHERVLRSLSWRSTKPLRLAKRLLSGRWSSSDSDRLRNLWRKALLRLPIGDRLRSRLIGRTLAGGSGAITALPDHRVATAVGLAEPLDGLPDVFVWSVIDFHFRVQRPQHLARAMAAKGHRVFYISVNFCDSDAPGFHFDPIDGCGRLYQIHLYLAGEPLIYTQMPSEEQVAALHGSLARLLAWTRTSSSISLVQHPYWNSLVRSVPNARVVYDCMDHHAGFENNSPAVLEAERGLVRESDLVIVTSAWLEREVDGAARATAVIRNAGEFHFFKEAPAEVFRDEHGRRVIGYYGAIAGWFDFDLVRRVAEAHPEALVVLVGHDSTGAAALLAGLGNVLLVGEVAYTRLPYWLHAFDVCLLPFKVIPLTLATNPVKVYEYLAAGKSIVAVDLPEMAQFDGLIRTAVNSDGFLAEVSDALATPASTEVVEMRQTFASRQTWQHRAAELDAVLQDLEEPRVSVVVLTYNNLAFTQACLHSVEAHSDYRNLEVIVVDNASSDGSVEYLRSWAAEPSAAGHERRLILNQDNLGFAAGNNVGLAAATGEVLVMLNNDTFVTPGWVRTLRAHLLRDGSLGLVGPVTNNIGNEARIEICYADMDEMVAQAGNYTRQHPGEAMPIDTVAFFCVMLPRAVYDSVGGLDEAFGLGFFEDDDYCRRAGQAGWKVACAEDVFVHHHLSASFDQVGAERKRELFERNKAIYESKWGAWKAHAYRPASDAGRE